MNLVQRSTPRNLIPFHLDKQSEDTTGTTDSASTLIPANSESSHPNQACGKPQGSSSSVDSEVDVNLSADEMVKAVIKVQTGAREEFNWGSIQDRQLANSQ